MSSQFIVKPLTTRPVQVYRATHDAPQRRALLVGAAGLEGVAPTPVIHFSSLLFGSRALPSTIPSPHFSVGQSARIRCCLILDFSEQDPEGPCACPKSGGTPTTLYPKHPKCGELRRSGQSRFQMTEAERGASGYREQILSVHTLI